MIAPLRLTLFGLAVPLALCAACAHDHGTEEDEDANWSVTAWGSEYEIFPEVEPLIAGQDAMAYTHVTTLADFSPLTEGEVAVVLQAAAEEGQAPREEVYREAQPVRPGIYSIPVRPPSPGEYALLFRVTTAERHEEIPAGRVRVGTAASPGGVVEDSHPAGEPISFLKEEQWRTDFATEWVGPGKLRPSVRGLGKVGPAAAGEITLTSTTAAVVRGTPWPFAGQRVARGQGVFQLFPQVASERSLASLEATVKALKTELETTQARRSRLEELLALEAASRREVEEIRSQASTLEARLEAARRDLAAARSARLGGGTGGETLMVQAPFAGQLASVLVSPGEAVAAGAPLGRLVRTDAVWIEIALSPHDAMRVSHQAEAESAPPVALLVTTSSGEELHLAGDQIRWIARAPEIDQATATHPVWIEVRAAPALPLGTVVEVEVLLAGELEGIVIPTPAVIDDGGVDVVYVQLSGESFVRQPVDVVLRQGGRTLVEGLAAGRRLVTAGGAAIRRSALLAGGEVEGHVH